MNMGIYKYHTEKSRNKQCKETQSLNTTLTNRSPQIHETICTSITGNNIAYGSEAEYDFNKVITVVGIKQSEDVFNTINDANDLFGAGSLFNLYIF